MQGKRVTLLTAAVLWIGIFLFLRFSPNESELLLRYAGWSKFSGVMLPANYARELPFPIPNAVLSLAGWTIPRILPLFYLPDMIFGLGAMLLLGVIAPESFGLFFAGSLWTVWVMESSFAAAMTLFLASLILVIQLRSDKNQSREIILAFVTLWLSMTSLAGWIFTVIFWIYKLETGFSLKKAGIGGAIILYSLMTSVVPYVKQNSAASSLAVSNNLTGEVDTRVRYETKLNNYIEPVPLAMKRIVYNKPYFAYRQVTRQIINLFSLEKFAFPGQEGATVARSLWGSKGLPWVYFWMIPMAGVGIMLWRKADKELKFTVTILAVWGITAMAAGKQEDWLINGIGLVTAGLMLISRLTDKIKPGQKAAVYILLLISAIPAMYHFVTREEVWRDNRPLVQEKMAEQAAGYGARQVTTILGRSFLYYGWLNKVPPSKFWQGVEAGMRINGVKFEHFEKPQTEGVYVGLPGEFLGSLANEGRNDFSSDSLPEGWLLLESDKIADSVSFGNGDYIWTVEISPPR